MNLSFREEQELAKQTLKAKEATDPDARDLGRGDFKELKAQGLFHILKTSCSTQTME